MFGRLVTALLQAVVGLLPNVGESQVLRSLAGDTAQLHRPGSKIAIGLPAEAERVGAGVGSMTTSGVSGVTGGQRVRQVVGFSED